MYYIKKRNGALLQTIVLLLVYKALIYRILYISSINLSTELLKWRPMPDKTRKFTLRHNVQRHLGQSEDWIIKYHW